MQAIIALAFVAVASAAVVPQVPPVWDALRVLRGGKDLTTEQILNLLANAVPGQDYPINAQIPTSNIECSIFKQAGYYADTSSPSNCQVFHRCDENGVRTDYLCGNGSLFNQITLVCDWFYNVDCPASAQFVDYSNSRIGEEGAVLLDNQNEIQAATGAVAVQAARVPVRAPAPARAPAPVRNPGK